MNILRRFRGIAVTALSCAGAPVSVQQPAAEELAQALQACLAKVDQDAIEELRRRGEALGEEMKALCAAGRRDEAQSRALAGGRSIAESPALRALGACGEMVRATVQHPALAEAVEGRAGHVCDTAK